MKFAVITCVLLCGVAASPQWPVYSSQYSSVYYQTNVPEREVPQTSYDPESTSENPESENTTTERESEQIKGRENDEVKDKLTQTSEVEGLKEEAVYYIYHPSGLLQRVVYLTRDDPQNMAYTQQFKYENVEPIREPIYTYDPETLVLQQLQR